MPVACFDLEGPLSPQDNAYEVLGSVRDGHRIFEAISRYDDVLTMEARAGYEPGDTLKLIVPFLIYHGIGEKDIAKISKNAKIVQGARETISELKEWGWKVHIISTSYQQHAHRIGSQLGIGKRDVACTHLPLDDYLKELKGADIALVAEMEAKILKLAGRGDEATLTKALDEFFWRELPGTSLGKVFQEITVIGGERKVKAIQEFLRKDRAATEELLAIGDSITDFKMLAWAREGGGLAVVFNGNEYAIPHADVGVAAVDMRSLLPIATAFADGGKVRALAAVEQLQKSGLSYGGYGSPGPIYHVIRSQEGIGGVLEAHKKYRKLVRGEASKLG